MQPTQPPMTATKFLMALAGVLGVLGSSLGDGHITSDEVGAISSALIAAALVYWVPNRIKQ